MFDRLESDFAAVLGRTEQPHRMYTCSAAYRDASGKTHRVEEGFPGPTSAVALADFLKEKDDEYEGSTRVSQSARLQV